MPKAENSTKNREDRVISGEMLVLVHGLWMTGLEMHWLGNRLKQCGYDVHYFHYSSLTKSPAECAGELADYIGRLNCGKLNIVAHSLGGVVVLNLFDLFSELPEGRVLLMGSPVMGSGLARIIASHAGLRMLLGTASPDRLMKPAPAWRGERDIGVIAGTSAIGVGRVLGGLQEPSDGTVSVWETRLPGATDFLSLNVNHMGMLFSAEVAKESCFFLHYGRFNRGEGAVPENTG